MTECRNCGAKYMDGLVVNGICEDCRSPEAEFRMLPKLTDRRRQAAYERYERSGAKWQVIYTN